MSVEFRVLEERENLFLDRVEITLEVNHFKRSTPSKREIAAFLKDRLGINPSNALIVEVRTESGMNKSYATIYYYPKGIDFSQIEPSDRTKVAANYLGEGEKKS